MTESSHRLTENHQLGDEPEAVGEEVDSLLHQHGGSIGSDDDAWVERKYSERRIESVFGYLKNKFMLRQQSKWFPMYELETRDQSRHRPGRSDGRKRPKLSLAFNCCYISFAVM